MKKKEYYYYVNQFSDEWKDTITILLVLSHLDNSDFLCENLQKLL